MLIPLPLRRSGRCRSRPQTCPAAVLGSRSSRLLSASAPAGQALKASSHPGVTAPLWSHSLCPPRRRRTLEALAVVAHAGAQAEGLYHPALQGALAAALGERNACVGARGRGAGVWGAAAAAGLTVGAAPRRRRCTPGGGGARRVAHPARSRCPATGRRHSLCRRVCEARGVWCFTGRRRRPRTGPQVSGCGSLAAAGPLRAAAAPPPLPAARQRGRVVRSALPRTALADGLVALALAGAVGPVV